MLALGPALLGHEAAHVLVGWLAGGSPTLLTATEVKGDFATLSPAGLSLFGASGSIFNLLLCALGWLALRRKSATAEFGLFAWLLFAINGFLVTNKMLMEPLTGFGDWMTILGPFPATGILRVVVAALGLLGVVFMVRRSGAELARLLPAGKPSRRLAEGRRIVGIAAAVATLLVLGSAVASPVGATRALLLALGGGLGPFIPMVFGIRFVGRLPADGRERPASGGRVWAVAGGLTTALIWFVVGPGVSLTELLG